MSSINDTTTNLLATSSNKLGFDLWKTISSTKGNLSFSPTSVATALTMAWAGARGDTAAEMSKVLHLDISPEVAMAEYSKLTAGMIYDANFAGIDLAIANRLFGDKSLTINDKFIKDLAETSVVQPTKTPFGAGPVIPEALLATLDFENDSEGARKFINDWISTQTKFRINDLLPSGSVDNSTRLVIANALYFLANWEAQFDKSRTSKDVFKSDGDKFECDMMYRKGKYRFAENQDIQVIALPYTGNSMSMVIVLPNDVDGLPQIEKTFSTAVLSTWLRQLRSQEVMVRLPRFTIDPASPIALSGHLKQLGMEKAFINGAADFSGISDEPLPISEAYHKTFIKVNEKGTEMAAATAVAMSRSVSMGPSFCADHPFAWFIVDSTNDLVLGMGRVAEPKE